MHKRILILGPSASGKTSFARKLGKVSKLPVIFTDSIIWKPGWRYIGGKETAQKLLNISSEKSWIIEGCIVKDVCTEFDF